MCWSATADLAAGAGVAAVGVACVLRARRREDLPLAAHPVRAEIRGHTMGYVVDLAQPELVIVGYLFATVGALLISGDRGLLLLGVLVATGAMICWSLWELEFVSTWCAFAAVGSVALLGWVNSRESAASLEPADHR